MSYKTTISLFLVLIIIGCGITNNKKEIVVFQERFSYECGPRCLQMIMNSYGKVVEFDSLAKYSEMDEFDGTSLMGLSQAAEKYEFRTLAIKIPFESNNEDIASLINVQLPCIIHWQGNYFVIVEKINKESIQIIHPSKGRIVIIKQDFLKNWIPKEDLKGKGIVLMVEPSK